MEYLLRRVHLGLLENPSSESEISLFSENEIVISVLVKGEIWAYVYCFIIHFRSLLFFLSWPLRRYPPESELPASVRSSSIHVLALLSANSHLFCQSQLP